MPHFKCLPCKTRLYGGESQAEAIGHLCPVCGSLLKPVGDLGEIVGYGVIETREGTWHSGASGAGQLIADRVGEIIATRARARTNQTRNRTLRRQVCQRTSPIPQLPHSGRRRGSRVLPPPRRSSRPCRDCRSAATAGRRFLDTSWPEW